ncbi:methyltransferase domain-containing protein [Streptomyces sp. NPDC093085]|uniref:methyltransferase domain-containing protein n=1 Tax=Streptomyces sp. NPDC093085 TaxID=3155068 RepID=UPI00341A2A80
MNGDGSPGSAAALAAQLTREGHLAPAWRDAFAQVDRARFLPDRIWVRGGSRGEAPGEGGYHPVDRAADPARWHTLAYEDRALVTHVEDPHLTDDGTETARVPVSSASMPRIVARMLDALDIDRDVAGTDSVSAGGTGTNGIRVLEIGTGTGYNAALLSHRLGDRNVVSVEVDPRIADTARANLKAAGHAPTVHTGDGTQGASAYAPYDRTIVTCALHTVPHALVEQTAPGGVIVLPWGTGLYNGVLLRLTRTTDPATTDPATASGPVIGDSAFMWNRGEIPHRDVMATVRAHPATGTAPAATGLDPRAVFGDEDATFTAGVLVPGCRYSVGHGPEGEFTLWLADHATGSWAGVDYVPGAGTHPLQQHGPRALWDEVREAYGWWRRAGSPARTRYGLTVTPTHQYVWLDTPNHPVSRPMDRTAPVCDGH